MFLSGAEEPAFDSEGVSRSVFTLFTSHAGSSKSTSINFDEKTKYVVNMIIIDVEANYSGKQRTSIKTYAPYVHSMSPMEGECQWEISNTSV